jgi:enhancing lycopene biosynthesis protein 2
VNRDVRRLIKGLVIKGKPVAALCIAPVLLARVLGDEGFSHTLTIGNDKETAQTLALMGSTHAECAVDKCVYDHHNKIITTPAYMLGTRISEVAVGIEAAVKKLLEVA